MLFKSIVLGCDHAGFELKETIKKYLQTAGISVTDVGTFSGESVDYPDFAVQAAKCVQEKTCDGGIVICGSGIGVSISANKIAGIRAALCSNSELARLSRLHNNANMLAMGARFTTEEIAIKMVDAFLTTEFEGGRHIRRVDKIHALTNC